MPLPKKEEPPKYEGPFDDQDEEDAAYSRYTRLRERRAAEKKALEEEEKGKKRGKLLPIVE